MANWSTDSIYFGTLPTPNNPVPHVMKGIYPYIQFTDLEEPYVISGMETIMSDCVAFSGEGKYGALPPFTEDSLRCMCEGVVIHFSQYDMDITLAIIVNHDMVYKETLSEIPPHLHGKDDLTKEDYLEIERYRLPFKKYEGKTDDEKEFFKRFWAKFEETCPGMLANAS